MDDINYQSVNSTNLIIDMSDMRYMNSTGLNILVNLLTIYRNKGHEAVIINVPEKINQLLVITKLNSVFNIINSLKEAEQYLNKNK